MCKLQRQYYCNTRHVEKNAPPRAIIQRFLSAPSTTAASCTATTTTPRSTGLGLQLLLVHGVHVKKKGKRTCVTLIVPKSIVTSKPISDGMTKNKGHENQKYSSNAFVTFTIEGMYAQLHTYMNMTWLVSFNSTITLLVVYTSHDTRDVQTICHHCTAQGRPFLPYSRWFHKRCIFLGDTPFQKYGD